MLNHIILGIFIVLTAWISSPVLWLYILIMRAALNNPGEFVLNQERLKEQLAARMRDDRVFDVCCLPLYLIWIGYDWLCCHGEYEE